MQLSKLVKLGCASLLCGLGMNAYAANDIVGKWQCSGYDPETNAKINMTGVITKTGDNTYSFKDWTDIKTGKKVNAAGVQNKAHDENFAIVYWKDDQPGYIGFGVYQLQPTGELMGHVTTKEGKLVSEELCTRVKA